MENISANPHPHSFTDTTAPKDDAVIETTSTGLSESFNIYETPEDTSAGATDSSDVTSTMPLPMATTISVSVTTESPRRTIRVSFIYDEDEVDDEGRNLRRSRGRRPQLQMDVDNRQTVGEIKELVRAALKLPTDEISASSDSHERQVLALSFAGATLDNLWRLVDVGIKSGATIRAYFRSEKRPSFTLVRRIDGRSTPVYRPINFQTATGSDLRAIASRTSGLPVGVFRLVTSHLPGASVEGGGTEVDENIALSIGKDHLQTAVEIFDCQTLDKYGLELGCTVVMETWDGWSEFLSAAFGGFSSQVIDNLDTEDEAIAFYQLKTALYVAAHFGYVDLSVTLVRAGVRPDDVVGEHPTKAWAGKSARHVDTSKTPIHEAAEAGQLAILRYFVHQDQCSVLARDGNDLTPLSIALRNNQKACASFLLMKQWSKVPFGKKQAITVNIMSYMRRWAEYARNRVVQLYGAASVKSSVGTTMIGARKRRYALVGTVGNSSWESPLVGHGVQLDGVTPSLITSKPTSQVEIRRSKQRGKLTKEVLAAAADQISDVDPEKYFKTIALVQSLKSQSKAVRRRNGSIRRHGSKAARTQAMNGAGTRRLAATTDVAAQAGANSPHGRGQGHNGDEEVIDEKENASVGGNGRREKVNRSESITTVTIDEIMSSQSRSLSPPNPQTISQRRQSDLLRLPPISIGRKAGATPSVANSSVMTRGETRTTSADDTGSVRSTSPQTTDDDAFQRQQQVPKATKSQTVPKRSLNQMERVEKSHLTGNRADRSSQRRSINVERSSIKQRSNHSKQPENRQRIPNSSDASGMVVPPLDVSAAGNHPQLRVPLGAISSSTTASTGDGWQRRSYCNEVVLTTRRAYEQRRGVGARDYAVQCLTLAQRFDKLSWLGQVRQAVAIARAGVRRVYDSEEHLFGATSDVRAVVVGNE